MMKFWEKVKKTEGCWEWRAATFGNGYGHFAVGNQDNLAHRFSWRLKNGEIPDGLLVCHECDNRLCVNPKHLWLGTQKDNLRDMDRKGRRVNVNLRGERHGGSKLTEKQVLQMRSKFSSGGITLNELGAQFGVTGVMAGKIVRRRAWTHLS